LITDVKHFIIFVTLTASVVLDADKPPKAVTIRITHPNSCCLKYDELDLKLRKATGREARLCYMGHVTMENRHGLAVAGRWHGGTARFASHAESQTQGPLVIAVADKAYDTKGHVEDLRAINVTPHVAQYNGPAKIGKRRRSSIDAARQGTRAMACRRSAAK